MSKADFQLIDNEPIDNSIIKRDYLKIYRQQGDLLNDPDQNVEFIIGENNNYNRVGGSHLGFDITLRKADGNKCNIIKDPATNEVIRLVNNAFANCFNEGTISPTEGMEIEQVKFLGQVSTIIRALTSKDRDWLSHFHNIDETQTGSNNTSFKQRLTNNHTEANRGKTKGHLPLEHIFVFSKTFEKITKNLGFHLSFRTNDLQDILFTKLGYDFSVPISSFHLYVPVLIPITETQPTFNESIKNNYTIVHRTQIIY